MTQLSVARRQSALGALRWRMRTPLPKSWKGSSAQTAPMRSSITKMVYPSLALAAVIEIGIYPALSSFKRSTFRVLVLFASMTLYLTLLVM